MKDIDLKDRKILYILDRNARLSFSQIGKKVGLPKSVVTYRISSLIEKGVVNKFFTLVNSYKLGYQLYRIHISFQYASPQIKKEIIQYFVNYKNSCTLHEVEGRFDLALTIYVKDLSEFHSFWIQTLSKYRDYFKDLIFSIYFLETTFRYDFILNEKIHGERKQYELFKDKKIVKIDELDRKILETISLNARMPTTDIARNLGSTSFTINSRIKKMIESGIIEGFRTQIDYTKLGYRWYKVDMVLKEYNKSAQIISYLKTNPHFVAIDRGVGYVDLEVEFFLKSVDHLYKIMNDITTKFPDSIRNYTYISVIKTHKYSLLPP